jgi:integrase/recombinase XerD
MMPVSNGLLISNFMSYLKYEGGAVDEAIADHEKSVAHLAAWLEPMWLPDATRIMLQLYIGDLLNQGTSVRTIARRLSHLRRFFRFLVSEQEIAADPTQTLGVPKHLTRPKGNPPNAVTIATWVRIDRDAYTL